METQPSSMLIDVAGPITLTFVRLPKTGDELLEWRRQSGLSMKKAAKLIGIAYNTLKAYENREYHRIPKPVTLACAAIDAGIEGTQVPAFKEKSA
ncbi:MAG: helix-turn-helix transcriptional regulator [Parvibaculaceae bacterium]|nr:helix-turn-helix transcriptional regulator [Parvibaculaceae bacterium]